MRLTKEREAQIRSIRRPYTDELFAEIDSLRSEYDELLADIDALREENKSLQFSLENFKQWSNEMVKTPLNALGGKSALQLFGENVDLRDELVRREMDQHAMDALRCKLAVSELALVKLRGEK